MPIQLHRYGCRCPSCNAGHTKAPNPSIYRQQLEADAKAALAAEARSAAARKAAATRKARGSNKRLPK